MQPNVLQQLRDIHMPQALGQFPLAWGWYILLGIMLIVLGSGVLWAWSIYRRGSAKRVALKALDEYERAYQFAPDVQKTSAAIADLLKRVAFAYFPRAEVAALYGPAWLHFLNKTGHNIDFFTQEDALLIGPYQAQYDADLTGLFQITRMWIKQRGKPCLS